MSFGNLDVVIISSWEVVFGGHFLLHVVECVFGRDVDRWTRPSAAYMSHHGKAAAYACHADSTESGGACPLLIVDVELR